LGDLVAPRRDFGKPQEECRSAGFARSVLAIKCNFPTKNSANNVSNNRESKPRTTGAELRCVERLESMRRDGICHSGTVVGEANFHELSEVARVDADRSGLGAGRI
jgi:hypothetical protein